MENKIQNPTFPIISIIGNEIGVSKNTRDYFLCPKDYIGKLNKIDEQIIDSKGLLFKRGIVSFKKMLNPFWGFSFKFGRFGICEVTKEFAYQKKVELEDLKSVFNKFKRLTDIEENFDDFSTPQEIINLMISI